MNRQRSRTILITLAVIILSVFTTAYIFTNETKDFKLQKNLDIFYSLIRELNAFYVDEIEPDGLFRDGIDKMLNELDPYNTFYPESERENFAFMTTGKYGGIGSLIRRDGDYIVLSQIYKGFPADIAGLKAGDKLKQINGESLKGLEPDQVSEKLKGQPDTKMTLLIERQGKELEKTLTRKRISIPPVPYFGMLDDETGYIRFTNFTQDCSADVRKALVSLLDDQGAKKIILDVRSNPGGLLTEAIEIVNFFVGPGHEVVSTKGRVDRYDHTYKTTKKAVNEDLPLVVIINRSTASAAEILAGAVQDLDRGVVVGQRSYGKGLVQISRPLSYNATLKVTTAKYYIPSGRCIQALDFSNRNEDGSVGHIPDSLISEFKTLNGRIVKDGGGISPDYDVEADQLQHFATQLYVRSLIFDFATSFYWNNPVIEEPGRFRISDEIYLQFENFLEEREFSYRSASESALDRLSDVAKREKYYEKNKALFEEMRQNLDHKLHDDLKLYRDEVSRLLEDEIVGRYYYEEGLIKHSLASDRQILKAQEVINNNELYALTLKGSSGMLSSK
ncbi:MAG: S41 family peptidase [Bacteroidales bacterium]|nr:S41 family peptidase [Bacteroidales bacterium]